MTMNNQLSENELQIIKHFFSSIGDNNIDYVLLRGHQHLPDAISGNDLDVLVKSDQFEQAKKLTGEIGWTKSFKQRKNYKYLKLIRRAANNPEKAFDFLNKNRLMTYRKIRSYAKTGSLRDQYKEHKVSKKGINLHIQNHLAYRSTLNDVKVRVDPKVENLMISRSEYNDVCYIPSVPDEIVHLVCRGVYDKKGQFPSHYKQRLNVLTNNLSSSERKNIQDLLSLIFYNANNLVWEHILSHNFDSLRKGLMQFENY